MRLRSILCLAAVTIVLAGCAGPKLVSAPNLYTDSSDNPYAAVPPELQSATATVVYATDRQPDPESPQLAYVAKRTRAMAFGLCTVSMGENASWDDLVAASRTRKRTGEWPLKVTNIEVRGQFPALGPAVEINGTWSDDPAYVEECQEQTEQLHRMVAEQLAKTPYKELYVFVHGYNNTFESGAFRAAQIWHFVGRRGVPVLYSWPAGSPGLLRGYTRDRESGEFTNSHLKQFLKALASCPEVKKIHLIAHSRGTDVLATAVRELHIENRGGGRSTREALKLGQIVLAAPDIDLDVFVERFSADRVGFVAERLTIYVSVGDKAVGLANWLFGGVKRLGQLSVGDLSKEVALAVKNHPIMNLVEVRAKTDRTGHAYFLSSPAVLSDLILVLRDHKAPGAENGRPLIDQVDGFWELRDGYPYASPRASTATSQPSN